MSAGPRGSLPTAPGTQPGTPARKAGVLTHEDKVPRETDSPLEGDGFEPSVPREKDGEKAKESISHKTASAEGSNRAVPTKHPFLAGIEWRYPSGIRCQRVCRFRRGGIPAHTVRLPSSALIMPLGTGRPPPVLCRRAA